MLWPELTFGNFVRAGAAAIEATKPNRPQCCPAGVVKCLANDLALSRVQNPIGDFGLKLVRRPAAKPKRPKRARLGYTQLNFLSRAGARLLRA